MVRRLLYSLGTLLLVFGVVLSTAAQSGSAHVRVIHASPDAPGG